VFLKKLIFVPWSDNNNSILGRLGCLVSNFFLVGKNLASPRFFCGQKVGPLNVLARIEITKIAPRDKNIKKITKVIYFLPTKIRKENKKCFQQITGAKVEVVQVPSRLTTGGAACTEIER
jgi:hypothetical protein